MDASPVESDTAKAMEKGSKMYQELRKRGAPEGVARKVANNSRCWWRNSGKQINVAMTIAYFDDLGAPRLV